MNVPFVEPRSRMCTVPSRTVTSQCRLEMVSSSKQKLFVGLRPSRMTPGGSSMVCAARDPERMDSCVLRPPWLFIADLSFCWRLGSPRQTTRSEPDGTTRQFMTVSDDNPFKIIDLSNAGRIFLTLRPTQPAPWSADLRSGAFRGAFEYL